MKYYWFELEGDGNRHSLNAATDAKAIRGVRRLANDKKILLLAREDANGNVVHLIVN